MRPSLSLLSVALLVGALGVSGCASPGPGAEFSERDPYESTNRVFHQGNLRLDRNILRPVAQGYGYATPTLVQFLIGNAANHLDNVNDFANLMLQGEIEGAGASLARFTLNTVLGAGGLLDPATDFGIANHESDFGVTLGRWGVNEGAYLVLPLIGPTTTRDLGGRIVDRAFDPRTYVSAGVDAAALDYAMPASTAVELIDARNRNADLIDDVLYNSPDSYISQRAIYLQRRDAQIGGETAAVPDIFDDAPASN